MIFFRKLHKKKSPDRKYFYDDPDEGPSPNTSHPNFVKTASESFYYDLCDDFSPFGSDDGADALRMLEDWFRNGGGPHGVINFLRQTITNWNLGVPDNVGNKTEKGLTTWLDKKEINATYLASECRLRIAVAFGELKICGTIDPPVMREANIGFKLMLFLNNRSKLQSPDWKFAELEAERIHMMKSALEKL